MPRGYLCLVLHAHLPFVRHPEHADFLEEDWLFEAITETYLPLLDMLRNLDRDGVRAPITLSISPTLAAMLADEVLGHRYLAHLDKLIELSTREVQRTRWMPAFRQLAIRYQQYVGYCRDQFSHAYAGNLLTAFGEHFRRGNLELITSAATHGYLPLMHEPKARWMQIEQGCREFHRHFGCRPRGIWLPECGYTPGLDVQLRDAGLEYFFVDAHGIGFGRPFPRFGVYSPVLCPDSDVAALGRDDQSSEQVWSSVEGYPGDPAYRDFYRDVGMDLELEYLAPFLHSGNLRCPTGIKYYRITGATDDKQVYEPQSAQIRAVEHAEDFWRQRRDQVEWLAGRMGDVPPLVIAPFDAELFGHWWYEGPTWLEALLRCIDRDRQSLQVITPSTYLQRHSRVPYCQPAATSWGANGYSEVWLGPPNDWIYPHLHMAEQRMVRLAGKYPHADGLVKRALNQAARELLLAQSSDWAFILRHGTMVDYATVRTKDHLIDFCYLYEQLDRTEPRIDESHLLDLECRDNLFPGIDYRLYG